MAACGRTIRALPSVWQSSDVFSTVYEETNTDDGTDTTELPRLLTDRHMAYMSGDEEGNFNPKGTVTRGEVCEILYSLLANPIEGSCSFSDISPSDSCYEAVCCLAAYGVITDTTEAFGKEALLSRAQLVTMLSAFYPVAVADEALYVGSFLHNSEVAEPALPSMPSFSDISDHWARDAIENAVERGWIESGGEFYPDTAVTRAELCSFLNRAMGRSCDTGYTVLCDSIEKFNDVQPGDEGYSDIMEASITHRYNAAPDGGEYWRGYDLEPGFYRKNGQLYYVTEEGTVFRNGTYKVWTFDENGCYTTGLDELDDLVQEILLSLGTDDLDQDAALRKAWLYVTRNHTYIRHGYYTYGYDGVHSEFSFRALRFIKTWGGVCYDFASAFGILARALGFNAYIVKAEINQYYAPHGFVVIPENGINYIYDPELNAVRQYLGTYALYGVQNYEVYNYWYTPWW